MRKLKLAWMHEADAKASCLFNFPCCLLILKCCQKIKWSKQLDLSLSYFYGHENFHKVFSSYKMNSGASSVRHTEHEKNISKYKNEDRVIIRGRGLDTRGKEALAVPLSHPSSCFWKGRARRQQQIFCWHCCFHGWQSQGQCVPASGGGKLCIGGKSLACKRLNKMLLLKAYSWLNLG